MNKLIPIILPFFLIPNFSSAQEAIVNNLEITGWGFIRHETKENADYDKHIKNSTEFTSTRININLKSELAENYGHIIFQPQFSKISGLDEPVSSSPTSGGLTDSRLDIHQAYFAVKPTQKDNLYIFLGRQELAYGDHLIMGSVPWHYVGRSFDGAKIRYKISDLFRIDAFTAKLQENNFSTKNKKRRDSNLTGTYLSGDFGKYIKEADFYILKKENKRDGSLRDTSAYGIRLKSPIPNSEIDYRLEATLENVRLAGKSSTQNGEYQINFEIGYTFNFFTSRFALEYFDSTKNFDQLFPTGHKFLGYADQFSRRNIRGYVAHFSTKPSDKLSFLADFHIFQRHSNKHSSYNYAGNKISTPGENGNSFDIGNELDLTLSYNFTKSLQLSAGYAVVNPGKYIKDQDSRKIDATNWSYLQLLASF